MINWILKVIGKIHRRQPQSLIFSKSEAITHQSPRKDAFLFESINFHQKLLNYPNTHKSRVLNKSNISKEKIANTLVQFLTNWNSNFVLGGLTRIIINKWIDFAMTFFKY